MILPFCVVPNSNFKLCKWVLVLGLFESRFWVSPVPHLWPLKWWVLRVHTVLHRRHLHRRRSMGSQNPSLLLVPPRLIFNVTWNWRRYFFSLIVMWCMCLCVYRYIHTYIYIRPCFTQFTDLYIISVFGWFRALREQRRSWKERRGPWPPWSGNQNWILLFLSVYCPVSHFRHWSNLFYLAVGASQYGYFLFVSYKVYSMDAWWMLKDLCSCLKF